MSPRSERADLDLLNEIADRYRLQGYRVSVHPDSKALPAELRGFEVDLLATSSDETVVVEVKRSTKARELPNQLAQLTSLSRSLGWRVDLVSEPAPEGASWPRSRRRELLEDALGLLDDHKEAAVLLACSAVEGGLRELARKHGGGSDRTVPFRQLIAFLHSFGIIGSNTSSSLSGLADARNHAAHARSMGRLPTRAVREFIEVALWLTSANFMTPDQMVDWFFERFEDPAEWVPYESWEGGYQFPAGEPHDARDVLVENFSNAPDSAFDDALELIEPLGTEWVQKVSAQLRVISTTARGPAMAAKFVLKKGSTGKFRFSLVAANGEIVATSEAYESKAGAKNGTEAFRRAAAAATVVDETK